MSYPLWHVYPFITKKFSVFLLKFENKRKQLCCFYDTSYTQFLINYKIFARRVRPTLTKKYNSNIEQVRKMNKNSFAKCFYDSQCLIDYELQQSARQKKINRIYCNDFRNICLHECILDITQSNANFITFSLDIVRKW